MTIGSMPVRNGGLVFWGHDFNPQREVLVSVLILI